VHQKIEIPERCFTFAHAGQDPAAVQMQLCLSGTSSDELIEDFECFVKLTFFIKCYSFFETHFTFYHYPGLNLPELFCSCGLERRACSRHRFVSKYLGAYSA